MKEAPWMGTVPEPPPETLPEASSSVGCTRQPTCPAELHFWDCERAARQRRESDARKACSNEGHQWSVTRTPHLDTPLAVHCERCGKSYKMVESAP